MISLRNGGKSRFSPQRKQNITRLKRIHEPVECAIKPRMPADIAVRVAPRSVSA
jgi:hypothetical protein